MKELTLEELIEEEQLIKNALNEVKVDWEVKKPDSIDILFEKEPYEIHWVS